MSIGQKLGATSLRTLFQTPTPVLRLTTAALQQRAPTPAVIAGRALHPAARLLLTLSNMPPQPDLATLTPAESRAKSAAITKTFGFCGPRMRRVRDLTLQHPVGELPARLYEPRGALDRGPLVVYFHGGGFVDGTLDTADPLARFLAQQSRTRLLSVQYRKAPEHPFPEPVEDALFAFRWAVDHALELGADPSRVAVAGDSSGANLATVVCLLSADADGPKPTLQALIYPVVDASRKSGSFRLFGEGLGLTAAKYDWFLDHYCPPERRHDVRISPLLADDLSQLPPTVIITAGLDILRDEGREYARRLRDAGVTVTELEAADLFHGFARFFEILPPARDELARFANLLGRFLSTNTPL